MTCPPAYSYTPTFTASAVPCVAPGYVQHRSRIIVGTAPTSLFFRSKFFGDETNQIAVECTSSTFSVYFNNIVVTSYAITTGPGGIANLRSQITNDINSIIEMPPLGYDIYDSRTEENDNIATIGIPPDPGTPAGGLNPFSKTNLMGGSGAPTTAAGLAGIRTGPERSVFIVITTEDIHGNTITPPASLRIQQWNGTNWISYCNNIPGHCPLDGTC